MSKSIETSYLTTSAAISFARKMINGNNVFMTIGNPLASNTDIETPVNSTYDIDEVTSTMIGGLKITSGDIAVMANRNSWISGVVFDQYTPYAPSSCFVVTDVSETLFVYKCLNNNGSVPSTVAPTGTSTTPFALSDGYVWQYMWTVSHALNNQFATPTLVPVISDANVTNATVKSSIDSFEIDDAGRGYANYFAGTFAATDIVANTVTLHLPTTASAANGFYEQCIIENTNPISADYGVAKIITSYNGSTKTATLNSQFTGSSTNDTYVIRPRVIVSSRNNSNNALASAVINTSANTIQAIVVHARGSDHYAATANVYANSSVGVTRQAALLPLVSPVFGHGSNVFVESNASSVSINKVFTSNQFFTVNTVNFATVAIISAPAFDNVAIVGASGQMTRFTPGEQLLGYRTYGKSIGTIIANTSVITASGNTVLTGLHANDTIAIANSTAIVFGVVNAVTNTTSATIYGPTVSVTGDIYQANVISLGAVSSVNATTALINTYPSSVNVAIDYIAGANSHRSDTISSITWNQFNSTSLVNTTKITGPMTGTFVVGETVNANTITGTVIATGANTVIIQTSNTFQSNTTVTGQTSSATITSSVVTLPSYAKNTGDVIYITNNLPINIAANKTIAVNVTISF